jgi:ubiquinol-cytochrome c reductase cytochrome b subunit
MFFMPEMGGYFLEYNNFIPADPLKTPRTSRRSGTSRRTTRSCARFMLVLAIGVAAYVVLIWLTARDSRVKLAAASAWSVVLMKGGPLALDAKVWGVVMMGVSTLIFFVLPWLDRSPVKSIRYKGVLFRTALTIFVINFIVLGYYGVQTVTPVGTVISQIGTLLYFAFFLLMPWYSADGQDPAGTGPGDHVMADNMKKLKTFIAALLFAPAIALAAGAGKARPRADR